MRRLVRDAEPLTVGDVVLDDLTAEVLGRFDITEPDTDFHPWSLVGVLPETWRCGLVVGASGTGKSTLLASLGEVERPVWAPDLPVAAHFADADDAVSRLGAVGLNSVPTWAKPYRVLSTGERFRADLARSLRSGALVDEYTSTVSRTVAQSASRSLGSWLRRNDVERLVFATCHYDVVGWLQPDWIVNTDSGTFSEVGERPVERWWMRYVSSEDGALVCERG